MKLTDEETPKARVEMTPIMDVVFLLLVFFIYAFMTMTVQRGMKVELPKADGVVSKQQNIRVVLTAENQLLLDGRTAMSLDAAADSVALRYESLNLPVIISADRHAHVGVALELMAALRAKGIQQVTYQVEKSK
ncbi:MAG: biopolymer transporter ExbD [Kiritimatiellae bacterium]|nr:biopolymer transporter ExbD [Kiritimatiellia bacterium]